METGDVFRRRVHNFLTQKAGGDYQYENIETLKQIIEYLDTPEELRTHKVALLFICLGEDYWQYAKDAIEGARKFFLPGHKVDYFLWTDLPEKEEGFVKAEESLFEKYNATMTNPSEYAKVAIQRAREFKRDGVTIFPTEFQCWPAPTLYRYNLFLQQEDILKDYDYIFYCDIDMRFINIVGDEIFSPDLTAALHPMYALKKQLWPPYEPNVESSAYIKRPGGVIVDNGQPRFMPMYFAGGFQGGKSKEYLEASREIRKMLEEDANLRNYIAIWNDESYWNKYLSDHHPSTVLSPSYIYPDSLLNEYYIPIWGTNYPPKIITLTKKHTLKKLTFQEQQQLSETKKIK